MNCYKCSSKISVYRFNQAYYRVQPFCQNCHSFTELAPDHTGITCPGCNLDFTTIKFLERFGCERCYETFKPQEIDFDQLKFYNINGTMQKNRKIVDRVINEGFLSNESQNAKTEWQPTEIQPENQEIIIRVRVARNFVNHAYVSRMPQVEKDNLQSYLISKRGELVSFLENQLKSNDFLAKSTVLHILNDEDHLRIAFLRRIDQKSITFNDILDFQNQIQQIIAELDSTFWFQFHTMFGYLTACPSNSGTGIRYSIRMPSMGLRFTAKQQNYLDQNRIQIRGSKGEGSKVRKSVTFLFGSGNINSHDFEFVRNLTVIS